MTLPRNVGAIVFDCDGLLLDTETCWSRAEAALFADHGFGFGPAEKDLLIGRTLESACENMAEYFGRPGSGPQLQAELLPRVEAELSTQVDPMPGARQLLEHLGSRVPIAVATNSPRAMLTAALNSSGLDQFFEISIAADEVAHPKPDPQIYLQAFGRLNATPHTGVALEDSSTGVAAARAAGAFVITVPSQRGKQLDGDYITDTLGDSALVGWAQTVECLGNSPSRGQLVTKVIGVSFEGDQYPPPGLGGGLEQRQLAPQRLQPGWGGYSAG